MTNLRTLGASAGCALGSETQSISSHPSLKRVDWAVGRSPGGGGGGGGGGVGGWAWSFARAAFRCFGSSGLFAVSCSRPHFFILTPTKPPLTPIHLRSLVLPLTRSKAHEKGADSGFRMCLSLLRAPVAAGRQERLSFIGFEACRSLCRCKGGLSLSLGSHIPRTLITA